MSAATDIILPASAPFLVATAGWSLAHIHPKRLRMLIGDWVRDIRNPPETDYALLEDLCKYMTEGQLWRRAQVGKWQRRFNRFDRARRNRYIAVLSEQQRREHRKGRAGVLEDIGTAEAAVIRQCLTGDLPEEP